VGSKIEQNFLGGVGIEMVNIRKGKESLLFFYEQKKLQADTTFDKKYKELVQKREWTKKYYQKLIDDITPPSSSQMVSDPTVYLPEAHV
jgi:hypothetical protein